MDPQQRPERRYPPHTGQGTTKGEIGLSGLDLQLSGKRALVTGGSRGVGAATVHLLAKAGADVAVSYHSRAAEAEEVVNAARAMGVRCWAEGGDLTDRKVVDRLFERVDSEFGGLDIFVGMPESGPWPTYRCRRWMTRAGTGPSP